MPAQWMFHAGCLSASVQGPQICLDWNRIHCHRKAIGVRASQAKPKGQQLTMSFFCFRNQQTMFNNVKIYQSPRYWQYGQNFCWSKPPVKTLNTWPFHGKKTRCTPVHQRCNFLQQEKPHNETVFSFGISRCKKKGNDFSFLVGNFQKKKSNHTKIVGHSSIFRARKKGSFGEICEWLCTYYILLQFVAGIWINLWAWAGQPHLVWILVALGHVRSAGWLCQGSGPDFQFSGVIALPLSGSKSNCAHIFSKKCSNATFGWRSETGVEPQEGFSTTTTLIWLQCNPHDSKWGLFDHFQVFELCGYFCLTEMETLNSQSHTWVQCSPRNSRLFLPVVSFELWGFQTKMAGFLPCGDGILFCWAYGTNWVRFPTTHTRIKQVRLHMHGCSFNLKLELIQRIFKTTSPSLLCLSCMDA